MEVKLVIEQGKTRTKTLHLRHEEGLIGRERGCNVRIPSPEVSRRHCILRIQDGYVTVEDLNSSNGTQLNGEDVQGREVVRPGDRLRVGPVTFIVEYQLTPEAIDRLLRGEESVEAAPEFDALEEVEAAPSTEEVEALPLVTAEEEEDIPVAYEELELVDPGQFQLPETEELRDILTGLGEDEEPPKKKKKKGQREED
jgi:pSer/pThr/pTyr-binding forkhead associated (FHA) protein